MPAGGDSGVTFDSAGDLWTVSDTSSTVYEYTASQLGSSGSPMPAVTLSGSGLNSPTSPTFDTNGDLWLANINGASVVEFTPAQIAASGSPTPNVTITGADLNEPAGLAFDSSGNLWVSSYTISTLVEYAPNQQATSGSPTPANAISGGSTGLNKPVGLAIAEAPSVTAVAPATGSGLGRDEGDDHGQRIPARLDRRVRFDAGHVGHLRRPHHADRRGTAGHRTDRRHRQHRLRNECDERGRPLQLSGLPRGGLRRRPLRLQRSLPRLHGWPAAQQADRGHGGRSADRWLLGGGL